MNPSAFAALFVAYRAAGLRNSQKREATGPFTPSRDRVGVLPKRAVRGRRLRARVGNRQFARFVGSSLKKLRFKE
jgi:hypothetical protein